MTGPAAHVFAGVPLDQLAAVHAAQAAGFALAEICAVERQSEGNLRAADLVWKTRLASEPELFEPYSEALLAHERRLGGTVAPLDDDLDAWIRFLCRYRAADDPNELVVSLGLGLPDMSRLSRAWAERMERSVVAKSATKLTDKYEAQLERGEDVALPVITVTPGALTPSATATMLASASEALPLSSDEGPALPMDEYAAVHVELEVGRGALWERLGLDAGEWDVIDDRWQERIAGQRDLRRDFGILKNHYRHGRDRRRDAAAPPARQVPEPSERTRFIASSPPPRSPDVTAQPFPAFTPVLPFRPGQAQLDEPTIEEQSGQTLLDHDVIRPPTMPFRAVGLDLAQPVPTDTLDDIDVVAAPALPFRKADDAAPASVDDDALQTLPVDDLAGMTITESNPLSVPPLPFGDPDEPDSSQPSSRDSSAGDANVDLTLEQLASFHAELAVWPEGARTIRARYGLADERAQRSLEASWAARLRERPGERLIYDHKLAEFKSWLRARHS